MELLRNFSLRNLNSFGLDVKASWFSVIDTVDDLRSILADEKVKHLDRLIIGGGSNILFTRDFEGLVLLNRLNGITLLHEDADHVLVKAASGEVWHNFVMTAVEQGWAGIENLSLIPGSVGASPMQNIGAYGVEVKQVIKEVEAVELSTGNMRVFSNEECRFGYRESIFKHELRDHYFITAVTYSLSKTPTLNISYGAIASELEKMGVQQPGIKDVSAAVIRIRQSKLPDPTVLGNAGSFFKNPEIPMAEYETLKQQFPNIVAYPAAEGKMKIAAGWLIEQCGWKGKQVGNTGSHKDQALVLVNYGGASGREIYNHALAIRDSVAEKFGVRIETEVNIV